MKRNFTILTTAAITAAIALSLSACNNSVGGNASTTDSNVTDKPVNSTVSESTDT